MKDKILESHLDPVVRARRRAYQFILVFPGDGPLQPQVIRFGIVDAKGAQIIGDMAIEDTVARVTNPKDVLDVREQAGDPGIDERRFRYLPADDGIWRFFMLLKHIHQIAVD